MGLPRIKASARGASRRKGTLFVCGLGIDRPHETTLGTISALKDCAAVFYIHGDGDRLKPFLAAFCADVRLYGGREFSALSDPQRIEIVSSDVCAELAKGRNVAYATYGHPMLCSDGYNVLTRVRSNGFDCRVLSAPSAVDGILAAAEGPLDELAHGYLVCPVEAVLERPGILKTELPAIVLGLDRAVRQGTFGDFCARVEEAYPAGHRIFGVKCADCHGAAVRLSGRTDQLRGWEKKIVHMMSLVLPLRRGRR